MQVITLIVNGIMRTTGRHIKEQREMSLIVVVP